MITAKIIAVILAVLLANIPIYTKTLTFPFNTLKFDTDIVEKQIHIWLSEWGKLMHFLGPGIP